MRFESPLFLIIFLIVLAAVYAYTNIFKKSKFKTSVPFPATGFFNSQASFKENFLQVLKLLRYLSLILIIIALARPQKGKTLEQSDDNGIDIMIALDTSSSMRSLDFKPLDRMSAAKKVTEEFVHLRKFDRIGLVVFSGLAFTQCPLTTDSNSLVEFIRNINIGDTGVDGTAIGSAIMTGVNRLKDAKTKSKIMVLITDGNNNMGEIEPLIASKIAKDYGIKIYTIGVGSLEGAIYLIDDPFFGRREIKTQDALNEGILKEISRNTGGTYFRAQDNRSFEDTMKQIDKLEKDDIKITKISSYNEIYKYFLFPAFLLLLLILILENSWFRKLP
ncbi:MAG: VWA domain-containing protein [Elusimicrobiota bacterium]|jgi:Ca-activated chloride channel family protein|nr:VWA domain-containing protein [Elusimicrobiota bacterium]